MDRLQKTSLLMNASRSWHKLHDYQEALQYGAKYLKFLGSLRDYGNDYTLWLSDYNRGLSSYQTSTDYGKRIDTYRTKIQEALQGMKLDVIEELIRELDLERS